MGSVAHRCRPQVLETEGLEMLVCGLGFIHEWSAEVWESSTKRILVEEGMVKRNVGDGVEREVLIGVKEGVRERVRGGIAKRA